MAADEDRGQPMMAADKNTEGGQEQPLTRTQGAAIHGCHKNEGGTPFKIIYIADD